MLSAEKYVGKYRVPQVAELVRAIPVLRMAKAGAVAALLGVLLALIPAFASSVAVRSTTASNRATQNQKNNKKQRDDSGSLALTLPDPQAIDLLVSQMLAAWQVGDVETMHKYYADDMAAVSGSWEPPLVGWPAYAAAYEKQHARTQRARLERTNTFTKLMGDAAWVDGQPARSNGHTTLVLERRAGNWIIVLNHTSATPSAAQAALPAGAPGSARGNSEAHAPGV
jgi:ketosteroid isomerase-like protein